MKKSAILGAGLVLSMGVAFVTSSDASAATKVVKSGDGVQLAICKYITPNSYGTRLIAKNVSGLPAGTSHYLESSGSNYGFANLRSQKNSVVSFDHSNSMIKSDLYRIMRKLPKDQYYRQIGYVILPTWLALPKC